MGDVFPSLPFRELSLPKRHLRTLLLLCTKYTVTLGVFPYDGVNPFCLFPHKRKDQTDHGRNTDEEGAGLQAGIGL